MKNNPDLQDGVFVRMAALPCAVHAFTLYNRADDTYNIYLNQKLMPATQQQALQHELHHIRAHDFEAQSAAQAEFLAALLQQ